jgi:hypothetical protein
MISDFQMGFIRCQDPGAIICKMEAVSALNIFCSIYKSFEITLNFSFTNS